MTFSRSSRLEPKLANPYYNRGLSYAALGQNDRAIQDFDEAIRLFPQDAYIYYSRGLAYQALAMSKEAELDFAKAKELGYNP